MKPTELKHCAVYLIYRTMLMMIHSTIALFNVWKCICLIIIIDHENEMGQWPQNHILSCLLLTIYIRTLTMYTKAVVRIIPSLVRTPKLYLLRSRSESINLVWLMVYAFNIPMVHMFGQLNLKWEREKRDFRSIFRHL